MREKRDLFVHFVKGLNVMRCVIFKSIILCAWNYLPSKRDGFCVNCYLSAYTMIMIEIEINGSVVDAVVFRNFV